MRVVDYIAEFIHGNLKVDTVFMVSGGGMMFLSDGVACNSKLKYVCNHHEQASAMAAVGYAKQRNDYGVALVTTGCGGTNAVTGLLNAWQDSARVIFISGQCKHSQTVRGMHVPLRQFGVQEADIVSIVSPISKYAVMIEDPKDIAYELEKAAWISAEGRPGPVWIDVPMNIQGATVKSSELRHFSPPKRRMACSNKDVAWVIKELATSTRPVILAGQGVDIAKCQDELAMLAKRINAPVVTSFLGGNSVSSFSRYYLGRIGTKGCRPANIAVANSDFLLVIGCRLSVSTTGHAYDLFARHAKIVVVDIDTVEHSKNTVRIDRFINSDLRCFLPALLARIPEKTDIGWLRRCTAIKEKYPIVTGRPLGKGSGISLYDFMAAMNEKIANLKNLSVVSDAGSSFYVTTQTVSISKCQRYITSGGQAEMGFSLPAAIGSAVAGSSKVVAITGDGSLQMNIQELQTLKHYRIPVKLFVWNNDGYLSIRATQRKFFDERFIGTDSCCGVSFPALSKIAKAYGLRFVRIRNKKELLGKIADVLRGNDPVVCEVMCMRDELVVPTIASFKLPTGQMKSMPPEDMYPFLPWEEFSKLMLVPAISRTE